MQKLRGRTRSFYHFIHCEVEFEVWIRGWQVYPGTLSCSHLAFYTDHLDGTRTDAFWQEGWLEGAWCLKAYMDVCVTMY